MKDQQQCADQCAAARKHAAKARKYRASADPHDKCWVEPWGQFAPWERYVPVAVFKAWLEVYYA